MKLASQMRSPTCFDADGLTGEDLAHVNLLGIEADAAAGVLYGSRIELPCCALKGRGICSLHSRPPPA
jgi:hypothetical protein